MSDECMRLCARARMHMRTLTTEFYIGYLPQLLSTLIFIFVVLGFQLGANACKTDTPPLNYISAPSA